MNDRVGVESLAAEKALRVAAEKAREVSQATLAGALLALSDLERERDKFLAQWSDAVELRERDFETLECEREATRLVAKARDAALLDAARLREILAELEWAGSRYRNSRAMHENCCPSCLRWQEDEAHAPDCTLSAALSASDSAAWLKRKLDEARAEERERTNALVRKAKDAVERAADMDASVEVHTELRIAGALLHNALSDDGRYDADKRTWRIEGAMAALHMGNHVPPKAIRGQAEIAVDLTWPEGAPKNKEGG